MMGSLVYRTNLDKNRGITNMEPSIFVLLENNVFLQSNLVVIHKIQ